MEENKLTQLESDVMTWILRGNLDVLDILRQQLAHVNKVERWFSGVGFYTEMILSEETPLSLTTDIPNTKSDFVIYDLCGYLNDERILVGFNVFIREGIIRTLEGFTFIADHWPDTINSYELNFCNEKERDLEKISMDWKK